MKIISKSLEETQKFAKEVLMEIDAGAKSDLVPQSTTSHQSVATVLLLDGDLGSGKTTFTQALARELGVKKQLTSPTFVLMKRYKIPCKGISPCVALVKQGSFKHLIHIDAYRLNSGADLQNLGWGELVANPNNLIVVEWSEKVADLWTGEEAKISFKFINDQTREMRYT